MTPQQIVGICIRLAALWLLIKSARYFTSVPMLLDAMDQGYRLVQFLLYGGTLLAIAVVLWIYPLTIANKILPRTSSNVDVSIRAIDAARVGCVLLGLWLLMKKFYIFSSLLLTEALDPAFALSSLPIESKVDIAVSVCELFLALFLIVRSDIFARVITRAAPFAK